MPFWCWLYRHLDTDKWVLLGFIAIINCFLPLPLYRSLLEALKLPYYALKDIYARHFWTP